MSDRLILDGIKRQLGPILNTYTVSVGGQTVPMFISLELSGTVERQRVLFASATVHQVELWLKQRARDKKSKDKAHKRITNSVEKLLAALPARARKGDRLVDYFDLAEAAE
jgi:hypothetical protein